jgi:hypothetical protein
MEKLMETLSAEDALRQAIKNLEQQRIEEGQAVKEQLHNAYDSLKPLNLIVSTLKDATVSIDLKDNMLNTAIGLTAGFLSKKLFEGVSRSPFKRLIGSALMFGVTNLVAKNPETIKSVGEQLMKVIRPATTHKENGSVHHQPDKRIYDLK